MKQKDDEKRFLSCLISSRIIHTPRGRTRSEFKLKIKRRHPCRHFYFPPLAVFTTRPCVLLSIMRFTNHEWCADDSICACPTLISKSPLGRVDRDVVLELLIFWSMQFRKDCAMKVIFQSQFVVIVILEKWLKRNIPSYFHLLLIHYAQGGCN